MRILVAVPAWTPSYGGPVTKLEILLPALVARGVTVEVRASALVAPGRSGLAECIRGPAGVPIVRLPTPAAWRWSPWPIWTPPHPCPHVVHVLGAWNGLSYGALTWAFAAGVPVVWEPLGMLTRYGRHRGLRRILAPLHRRWATRSLVVWTSRRERDEAGLTGGVLRANPVTVPRRLPDRAVARAKWKGGDGPIWGYLGRIAHRKGLTALLTAWRRAGAPGELWLAGPVEQPELFRQAQELPRVRYLGRLDTETRWWFLCAIDALLLVPPWGENFGNVVAEAVAVGTTAVVSPAVGAAEWYDRGVHVVDPEDLATLLRHGPPLAPPPYVPPALRPAVVAARQVAIYRRALGAG